MPQRSTVHQKKEKQQKKLHRERDFNSRVGKALEDGKHMRRDQPHLQR